MFCPLFEEEQEVLKRGGESAVEESTELCIVIVCVYSLGARAYKSDARCSLGGVTQNMCLGYMWRSTYGIASLQSLPDDFERFTVVFV